MNVPLSNDELNLLLSAVGAMLDYIEIDNKDDELPLRTQLEALQTKLMKLRGTG